MTVIFEIEGETDSAFTTDPEVIPGSRHLKKGDYVRLPNGHVYWLKSDYPTVFVLVTWLPEAEIEILEAKSYDPVNGKLI